jgi:hypothetical protein
MIAGFHHLIIITGDADLVSQPLLADAVGAGDHDPVQVGEPRRM